MTDKERKAIITYTDNFCMNCSYLHPDTEDPCKGCKMQEFVDSLYEEKQEESQDKTWKITISEHRELDITVTAKNQHDVEKMAELLSNDMGKIEMRRITK